MNIWEKILFKGESSFNGQIKVSQYNGVNRLIAGSNTQSQTLGKNGILTGKYWDLMIPGDIRLNSSSRVLILGLGGGTTAQIVNKKYGTLTIDGVDIDPLMVELGQKYLGLDIPNLNIHIQDAGDFVENARFKYDLICIDIFVEGDIPSNFETPLFYKKVKNILAKDGTCTINKIFAGIEQMKQFEKMVGQVFPKVTSQMVRGNPALDNVVVYAKN